MSIVDLPALSATLDEIRLPRWILIVFNRV